VRVQKKNEVGAAAGLCFFIAKSMLMRDCSLLANVTYYMLKSTTHVNMIKIESAAISFLENRVVAHTFNLSAAVLMQGLMRGLQIFRICLSSFVHRHGFA